MYALAAVSPVRSVSPRTNFWLSVFVSFCLARVAAASVCMISVAELASFALLSTPTPIVSRKKNQKSCDFLGLSFWCQSLVSSLSLMLLFSAGCGFSYKYFTVLIRFPPLLVLSAFCCFLLHILLFAGFSVMLVSFAINPGSLCWKVFSTFWFFFIAYQGRSFWYSIFSLLLLALT